MADSTSKLLQWILRAKDEISGSADSAAKALEKLDESIASDTKHLAAMQRAMRNLSMASKPSIEQLDKMKASISAQKDKISQAQGQYLALGGKMKVAGAGSRSLESRFAALTAKAQQMPGPIGALVSHFAKLKNLVGGGVIAAGLLAIAAAVLAVTVATAAGIRKLFEYGKAQADARRSELLRLEGLTKLRFMFQRIPGNAKEMQQAIDEVAAKTPASREAVAKFGEQLHMMGLRGKNYASALEGMALKAGVQGEAQAQAFASWAAGANMTGQSVQRLTDRVKAQIGGTAVKMMSSLTVQAEKQKEAFDSLFSGLGMEKYLSAWKGVNDLLTQATSSGRALKLLMTALLQPLINASTSGAPIVKRFFQGMILAALQFVNAMLDVRDWWRKTFGSPEQKKAIDDSETWINAGRFALMGLGGALIVATAGTAALALKLTAALVPALARATLRALVFAVQGIGKMSSLASTVGKRSIGELIAQLISFGRASMVNAAKGAAGFGASLKVMAVQAWKAIPALWGVVAPLLPFILAAVGVGLAIASLITFWDDLKLAFKQIDWIQTGKDILQGIINGISNPGALMASMAQLAIDAVSVFKGALGAKSPSKLFMRAGLTIPQGVAAGVEQGAPDANAAARDLIDVPKLGSGADGPGGALAPAGASAAGGGGRGVTRIEIGQVIVQASSSEPKQMGLDFRRELERVLEGLATELGARAPAGATP